MNILNIFGNKNNKHNYDISALKYFCDIILSGDNEGVITQCIQKMNITPQDIESILYILAGYDDDIDETLIPLQYYLISTELTYPDREIFFSFINNGLKQARKSEFNIEKDKYLVTDTLIEWLREFSEQVKRLEDLYVICFDIGTDIYHFTILTKEQAEKSIEYFNRLTSHIKNYKCSAYYITEDFKK